MPKTDLGNSHQITQVVLTPMVPNPHYEYIYVNDNDEFINEYRFAKGHWDMVVEEGPTDKFRKLVDLVGSETAERVWDLLSS